MPERPTGSGIILICLEIMYQHLLLKSLATGTGMETYLFVSQQNTDNYRLFPPAVLPFPGIVLAEMAQTDMGYFIPRGFWSVSRRYFVVNTSMKQVLLKNNCNVPDKQR